MSDRSNLLVKKYYENKNLELLKEIIDIRKVNSISKDPKYKKLYAEGDPFPHLCIQNLWEEKFLLSISDEFREYRNWETHEKNAPQKECKSSNIFFKFPDKTAKLVNFCNSFIFIQFLESITGISGLIPDPYLLGGGMKSTGNNGFLNLHADFN